MARLQRDRSVDDHRRADGPLSKQPSTRERGRSGEDRAAAFLLEQGLEILERNVIAARVEIDLVCRAGETIVFVEVRGRADDTRGHPFETIDKRKQARLRRGATAWLLERGLWQRVPVRFDAIAIVGDDLEWLPGAF